MGSERTGYRHLRAAQPPSSRSSVASPRPFQQAGGAECPRLVRRRTRSGDIGCAYSPNLNLGLERCLMLVHIVADYGPVGDLAFAEVVQRLRLYLPDAEPILTPVPSFATLAAGFCIAQLGLNEAPAGTL